MTAGIHIARINDIAQRRARTPAYKTADNFVKFESHYGNVFVFVR